MLQLQVNDGDKEATITLFDETGIITGCDIKKYKESVYDKVISFNILTTLIYLTITKY